MPNKKHYTAQQEALLTRLREVHAQHVLAKANMRAEIEAQYRTRLRDYEYQKSKLMNQGLHTTNAKGMPISKTDLGLAVGTQNWNVLSDLYALAADEYRDRGPQFERLDADTFRVNWLVKDDQSYTSEPWLARIYWRDDLEVPRYTLDFKVGQGDTYEEMYRLLEAGDRELWNTWVEAINKEEK